MTVKRTRLISSDRKKIVLDVAVNLAANYGYKTVPRFLISKRAEISEALVTHYLGRRDEIPKLILKTAIKTENLAIIAQGLSVNDPTALRLNKDLKERAVRYLMTK